MKLSTNSSIPHRNICLDNLLWAGALVWMMSSVVLATDGTDSPKLPDSASSIADKKGSEATTVETISGSAKQRSTETVNEHAELKHDEKPPETSAPLSIAPLDHIQYPIDRPSWLTQVSIENEQEPTVVVSSGPCPTLDSAHEVLQVMMRGAVESFLMDSYADARRPIDPEAIEVEDDWIDAELVIRRYDGSLTSGGEKAYESACLLRFDAADQEKLKTIVQNHQVGERLAAVGILALGGFASLLGGSIVLGGLSARQKQSQ